jgi:4-diphosphocytidyl-2-C-methyl-D-erythritol kinase
MIFFPNCKINLGLKILRRRTDGYHDLETVFYPLPLKDILELAPLPDTNPTTPGATPEASFTSYGIPIPGDPANNLCLKAWQLLRTDFPTLPAVQVHLYKNIPVGAGLGGGSADAAWTILGLNTQFQLGLSHQQLLHYAAELGSDCPFFMVNTPSLGSGRGEKLQPVELDLSPFTFALVDPGIHISTARAFSLITPAENPTPLTEAIKTPITHWPKTLVNDFEGPIFQLHPELQTVKDTLYTQGALYASLTGSGSSFFGIFPKDKAPADPFHMQHNYRILR